MSVASGELRSRFHHYGPWLLGGGAVAIAIIVEAARHHVVSRFNALFFVVLVPTIIFHEISHGVMANICGDDTAKKAGRLSLNPLRHIDPIGTVLLPILLILTTGRAFGWAKPVPVSINKLRNPRNQAVLVGLIGPVVNIVIALIAGFAFRFATHGGFVSSPNPDQWPIGDELLYILGMTNVFIAVFNLIPIPPLDGSAVVERLLPRSMLPGYYQLRSYSMILVLLVVFFAPGILSSLFDNATRIWLDVVLPSNS